MKVSTALAVAWALGATLLAVPGVAGDVYKWVDEDGVVHYTDQPPEGRRSTEMKVPTAPEPQGQPGQAESADGAAPPAWYDEWLAAQRERKRLEREQHAKRSAEQGGLQAHMLEACAEARQRLEILTTPCRAFFDGRGVLRSWCPNQATWVYKGEFRFIEDDERADMIRHYRAQLQECEAAGY
jgi:hypothetical protein